MWSALTSTLREGLTAFLIVAVMLAFFTRSKRLRFHTATRLGIGLSIPATAIAAALFSNAPNQALWEGLLALVGAACVAWIAWHMWETSRAPQRMPHRITAIVIAVITILMITRGGMEIALLIGTMVVHVPSADVIAGAALGPALAVLLGVLWSRAGQQVPQRLFAQVTAIFLFVLFLQLVVDGVHELSEANAFRGAETLRQATESFSSDGVYGQYTQYLLLLAPVAWWLVALFWGYGKAPDGRVADLGR